MAVKSGPGTAGGLGPEDRPPNAKSHNGTATWTHNALRFVLLSVESGALPFGGLPTIRASGILVRCHKRVFEADAEMRSKADNRKALCETCQL